MSTGDRAIEASLQRLQEDKDRFLTTQSAGNDSALVSSIGSYAGALRGAGRHEEAQDIDRKRHEFKTAGSGKKLTIARGLTKTLGGAARALVAHDVAADVLIEVGADVAAEILQDVLVPGMAIATVFRVGWRIVFGRRQRGDRRRFVFAAFRAAITGGVL
ncbi:unnamed protein product [Pylaiella littoralis]